MRRGTPVTTAVKSSRATTSTALPIFNKGNSLAHSLLGGWQLAGTYCQETGEPLASGFGGVNDPVGLGGGYTNYANIVNKIHYRHKVGDWFDTVADQGTTADSNTMVQRCRNIMYCLHKVIDIFVLKCPLKLLCRLTSPLRCVRSSFVKIVIQILLSHFERSFGASLGEIYSKMWLLYKSLIKVCLQTSVATVGRQLGD